MDNILFNKDLLDSNYNLCEEGYSFNDLKVVDYNLLLKDKIINNYSMEHVFYNKNIFLLLNTIVQKNNICLLIHVYDSKNDITVLKKIKIKRKYLSKVDEKHVECKMDNVSILITKENENRIIKLAVDDFYNNEKLRLDLKLKDKSDTFEIAQKNINVCSFRFNKISIFNKMSGYIKFNSNYYDCSLNTISFLKIECNNKFKKLNSYNCYSSFKQNNDFISINFGHICENNNLNENFVFINDEKIKYESIRISPIIETSNKDIVMNKWSISDNMKTINLRFKPINFIKIKDNAKKSYIILGYYNGYIKMPNKVIYLNKIFGTIKKSIM